MKLFPYILLVFALLAVWALVQYFGQTAFIIQMGRRANAIFTTPNSFAAALNLVNLLLIGLYLGGRTPRAALGLVLLLFAALLVSESRGGWIAFGGGLVLLVILLWRYGHVLSGRRLRNLLAGMVVLTALYMTHHALGFGVVDSSGLDAQRLQTAAEKFPLATMASSGSHRLQIYADAWRLVEEKPWLGHGFMSFGDHYGRVQSDRFAKTTDFVHNDYLQFWVEMGLPGLILLIALIGACVWQSWRALPSLHNHERVILLSLLAALGSYFAHALVDFVIYVPALFLIACAYMGYMNHLTAASAGGPVVDTNRFMSRRAQGLIQYSVVLLVAWLLFEPALAQVASHAAKERQNSEPAMAERLYGMAQTLAPYESAYYHQEAEWRLQTALREDSPELLQQAVSLYARAVRHNPYDVKGRYELARLNVRYGRFLEQPLSKRQIHELFSRVLEFRHWDSELKMKIDKLREAMAT